MRQIGAAGRGIVQSDETHSPALPPHVAFWPIADIPSCTARVKRSLTRNTNWRLVKATNCAVTHIVGAGNFRQHFTGFTTSDGFLTLVSCEFGLASKPYTARYSPCPTLSCPSSNQLALEFGKAQPSRAMLSGRLTDWSKNEHYSNS